MTCVSSVVKRTFAALAFGIPRGNGLSTRGASSLTTLLPRSSQKPSKETPSWKLFSTFQAPEPPQSKGMNVYEDIDFTVSDQPLSESSIRNSDPNAVFVVNGASRGIGLEFVKKLLVHTQGTIVAGCRCGEGGPSQLHEFLDNLDSKHQHRIQVVQLDIEHQDSIEEAVETIRSKHDRVDLLLNVAGILGDGSSTPGPERSLAKIERDWMEKTFQVNVIGPVMLAKELSPLMMQRRKKQSGRAVGIVANLSARVGSISDNGLGGWYSYRMSKSALNQATRTMANEMKRQSVWCISLHPGTTDTDLSKPFQKNVQKDRLFPVEFTVVSLMKVIDSMEESNSGGLYDWAGKAIPF